MAESLDPNEAATEEDQGDLLTEADLDSIAQLMQPQLAVAEEIEKSEKQEI